MAELGLIPKEAAEAAKKRGGFDIERIDAIEREVKHDVIAFLTSVAEHVGPEARFLHSGLTSSDVLDTCFNVQLVQAADILIADLDALLEALKTRAYEHKDTITVGRSHGIHAEPTTFGLKLAVAYAEFSRARARMVRAREEVATCAISGAVGTFAHVDPRVEAYVAKKLGLKPEPISTQVVPRDRHAAYFATLAVVASSVERLATEIRHLQRTEVLEAEEYFSAGQKGSSAMPHKRNPVLSENFTGLARIVRAYAMPALRGRRALARTGHLPLLGGADDRPRRHGDARFRAPPPHRHHQEPRGLSGAHARQYGPSRRADSLPARAAGAHRGGGQPRGRLSPRAAERHEGVAGGQGLPGRAAGRSGRDQGAVGRGDPRPVRPRLPHQACGRDLRPGVQRLSGAKRRSYFLG